MTLAEARAGWGELVAAAEDGVITPIHHRAGPARVALAPLSQAAGPVGELRAWTLSESRMRLGAVVEAAAGMPLRDAAPQVVTRYGRPVAVVTDVRSLPEGPRPG